MVVKRNSFEAQNACEFSLISIIWLQVFLDYLIFDIIVEMLQEIFLSIIGTNVNCRNESQIRFTAGPK